MRILIYLFILLQVANSNAQSVYYTGELCILARPAKLSAAMRYRLGKRQTDEYGLGHTLLVFKDYNAGQATLAEHPYGKKHSQGDVDSTLRKFYALGKPEIVCYHLTPQQVKAAREHFQNEQPKDIGPFDWKNNNCTDYAVRVFGKITGKTINASNFIFLNIQNPTVMATMIKQRVVAEKNRGTYIQDPSGLIENPSVFTDPESTKNAK